MRERNKEKRDGYYDKLLENLYTRANIYFDKKIYKATAIQCNQADNLIRKRKLGVSKYNYIFNLQHQISEIVASVQEFLNPVNLETNYHI